MSFFTSDIDIQLPALPSEITTLEDAKEELERAYAAIHILHAALTALKSRVDAAGIP